MKSIMSMILAVIVYWGTASLAPAAGANDEPKPAPGKKDPFKNVDVAAFEKLRANKDNVVLDVRTEKEFTAGHIPGAVNLDVNGPNFAEKVSKLDKNKTYLVHCGAGVRSARACEKMSRLDFPRLYNLEGGFTAWEKAGNKPEKSTARDKTGDSP